MLLAANMTAIRRNGDLSGDEVIGRLRSAAREIAAGNLNARVGSEESEGSGETNRGDVPRGAIAGLVHDFNEMAGRLQALVDAQKMLLRDVAHELRAPLARLDVGLELARAEATEPMNPHLDRIEWESASINKLIGQLLSLSYMQSVGGNLGAGRLSSTGLVSELLPTFATRPRRGAAKLKRRWPANATCAAMRDFCGKQGECSAQCHPLCSEGGVIFVTLSSEMRGQEHLRCSK